MRVFVQNGITTVQAWLSGKKYIKKNPSANALTRSTYDVCLICFQKNPCAMSCLALHFILVNINFLERVKDDFNN